jgi:hypothetical protein
MDLGDDMPDSDRRITENRDAIRDIRTRVHKMETDQALVTQSVKTLTTKFDTGMTELKEELRLQMEQARDERIKAREDRIQQRKEERLERQWWWGRVFGIAGAIATAAGVGGGAWYSLVGPAEPAAPPAAVVPVQPPVEAPP